MNLFLRAKHWQLFLFMFGIPLLFQFFIVGVAISNIFNRREPDPFFILAYIKFLPVILVLFMTVFFGWLWSIGVGLQKEVPSHIKLPVKRFKVLFIIPLVYILLFSSFIAWTIGRTMQDGIGPDVRVFAFIIPLHLFCIFCLFYCMYFVAKTFKTVEVQREVRFSDYVAEFFFLWFYPIGVWIIQPKINKIIKA